MARKDHTKKTLEDAIEIGKENRGLLPGIRNWCRHIVLKDESAGLVPEIYGLPITMHVSCPHAPTSSSGMKLDWIAGSFIIENCQDCKFHQSISEPNFGSKILAEKLQKEREATIVEQKKAETHKQLRESIGALLKVERSKAQITELSILQLVESLNDPENKEANANRVLEASKIDPGFFTPISLDALSLYFKDEQIGGICILSVSEVLKTCEDYPITIFQQAVQTLQEGKNFNDVALLFQCYIHSGNIRDNEENILALFDCLSYNRMIGEPSDQVRDYQNSIAALYYLIGLNRSYMHSIFKGRLSIQDAVARININHCLQEIITKDAVFVADFIPELVNSFRYIDDATFDSADLATCGTLGKLIKTSPADYYNPVREGLKKLSTEAQASSTKLFGYLLNDQELTNSHKAFIQELVTELIQLVLSKTEPSSLHEQYTDELADLRFDHINLIEPHFDVLLGYLSRLAEDEKNFLWYREEIKTKKPEEVSTFNPLHGMNWLDIDHEKMRIDNDIRHIKNILGEIMKTDKGAHLSTTQEVIKSLDSKTHARYKSELISLISNSVSDPYLLSGLIPSLYGYLFDTDSVDIRVEGMKFLDRLIDNSPQVITQTLFDLAEMFLKDPEVAIRALAIEIQVSIAQNIPDKFNYSNIDVLILSMVDHYVYIQKTAARKCRRFVHLMSKEQRFFAMINLMTLHDHYKTEDAEFSKDVVKDLVLISKDMPGIFNRVTKEYVIGYCESNEYYTVKEFVDILSEIKTEHREFEDDWLKIVINLFKKIRPGFRSDMDWRAELINEMYSLSRDCMHRNITLVMEFLESRKEPDGFDIINILHVLAYFEFPDEVVRYIESLASRISRVTATEGIFRHAELLLHFSEFATAGKSGEFKDEYLKAIKDALQESGS